MSQEMNFSADRLRAILATVTAAAAEIEKLIAATGLAGNFNEAQVEQLTLLFGNLASAAIQAVHNALGREVTAESVLALLPASAPLVQPSA
jgi:hypothetical protein